MPGLRFRLLDFHNGLRDLQAGVLRAPFPRDMGIDEVWGELGFDDDEREQVEEMLATSNGVRPLQAWLGQEVGMVEGLELGMEVGDADGDALGADEGAALGYSTNVKSLSLSAFASAASAAARSSCLCRTASLAKLLSDVCRARN